MNIFQINKDNKIFNLKEMNGIYKINGNFNNINKIILNTIIKIYYLQ